MPKTIHAKVVIIGSGPAGYTAAIYAARAMLEPILIQGIQPGGQLTITTDVENYPGFADVIQGPWLMEQMQAQATHVGTKIVTDYVTKVELAQRPFRLQCDSGRLGVAHLSDQNHIRVLAQNRPQPGGEGKAGPRVGLPLRDGVQLHFDRVFQRHHVDPSGVDELQEGIERGGLARARGSTGDQETLRTRDDLANLVARRVVES